MKARVFSILVTALCAISISDAQSTSQPSILFKKHFALRNTNPGDVAFNYPTLKSVIRLNANDDEGYLKSRRYKNGLQTRNEGIGLTAAGGTCLLGGPPLLAAGIINVINDMNAGNNGLNNNGTPTAAIGHIFEMLFGVLFTGAGLGMIVPGPILLHKGLRQMKKAKEDYNSN
jgi:hypothetical protein